ncbi:hypothetical protein T492DRAFT_1071792, partial [Pavlovales sp. CCMP2436]
MGMGQMVLFFYFFICISSFLRSPFSFLIVVICFKFQMGMGQMGQMGAGMQTPQAGMQQTPQPGACAYGGTEDAAGADRGGRGGGQGARYAQKERIF